MRHLLLLFTALGLLPLAASDFPAIPDSTRILSREEVKNFWVNHLRRRPLPPRPNGLHPERQRAWDQAIAQRRSRIRAIRNGHHDTRAQLVRLEHNAEAWDRLGLPEQAKEVEARLYTLREHLATIAKLEAEKRLWIRLGEALDRIDELEREISNLRAEVHRLEGLP